MFFVHGLGVTSISTKERSEYHLVAMGTAF